MKILVLNCGSSSLKFQLIETPKVGQALGLITTDIEQVIARGLAERIGEQDSKIAFEMTSGAARHDTLALPDHQDAIAAAFDFLKDSLGEIEGVGHRVVHGGEYFDSSVRMDAEIVSRIESVSHLAPLHNPHNLKGYYASTTLLPHIPQVAVFDTAFHRTLPPHAYLYGLPSIYYTRDGVRRYGFHGTSHRFLAGRFAEINRRKPEECTLITCHLGNGCSICAIAGGRSVDTSMGFTPLEGLLMGTRPGDIDPGAVLFLAGKEGVRETEDLLNHRAGMLGMSGISSDMRNLIDAAARGNRDAATAIDAFCYRITKYIAGYFAILGSAEAVIFAGGIGEHSSIVRSKICAGLSALGLSVDPWRNDAASGKEAEISAANSRLKAWVIPTNEELLIARDTARLV